MARALIIGYGNSLRGDDAFGWHVANRLVTVVPDDSVQVLAVHQLTPELAEPISEAALVVFIDASHEGEPGSWNCEEIADNVTSANSLAHHLTPASLLAYARTIFGVSPQALIIALAADSYDCCETLTPRAEAAVAEVLRGLSAQLSPDRVFLNSSKAVEQFVELH
jgi:hydrogenase maturation protease